MEKVSSFLFSGIHFDRKKFATDFAGFKEKKKIDDLMEGLSSVEDREPESEDVEKKGREKVRVKKRKGKTMRSENVEGFSVFNSSKLEKPVAKEENEQPENKLSPEKKKFYQQLERCSFPEEVEHSFFWEQYPLPTLRFCGVKLKVFPLFFLKKRCRRYGCKAKLLRNLAELGFKEPTPIERQAMPVLLSGRECFACASTGSGKTLAFVCPILMKPKHASKDGIRAVILCPTCELATQTTRECKNFAEGCKFHIKLMSKEIVKSADLSKFSCDILISTPLRLKLAIRKKNIDLN